MTKNTFFGFLNRLLITGLITVLVLIFMKKSARFNNFFTNNVMGVNFNFAGLNDFYNKYFGNSAFMKKILNDNVETVFYEKLEYGSKESYLDGVKLGVASDYFVPSLDSGIVVFVGEKEGYGNVVIVGGADGVDIWYGNLSNIGVNLYDYVSEGSLIGNTSDILYLVFKKDGNVLDYEDYI